uniref:Uncharacterized protein n=1 Tax=Candidatus Kentrum sp. SD TaxID=2126332 RepID=A0A451BQ00_9GAMM|nr:MAG: hypothetical protein BECKSD772D_GA0070982_11079 [Candidatus Kentron sp. SD]
MDLTVIGVSIKDGVKFRPAREIIKKPLSF